METIVELRPYQKDAIAAIRAEYGKGITKQLLSMSTGVGKTCIFSSLPENLKDILPKQMLVLLHREELADQAIDKLHKINPTLRIDKEMGEHKADPDLADVVVASVQSLGRKNTKRIDKYNWDNFDKFVVDEAHRSISQSYMNVYEAAGLLIPADKRLILGVTATPQRSDNLGLDKLYQKVVYSYGLREAIEQGYLSDVKGIRVRTKTSLDNVRTSAGEYDQEQLADTVNTPERNLLVFNSWLEHGANRITLGFGVNIKHSQDLAEMFKTHGIVAEAVWGADPLRDNKIARYRKGEIQVLFNNQLLTEGFDLDIISCIILAAPTKSGVVFSQRIGRGTRLSDGKIDCLIIDLVDSSTRHSLVTLPTLLGMSAALDLKGGSLVRAIQLLEEKQELHSHIDFSNLADIESIDSYIEAVDLFNIPILPEVDENSEMLWSHAPDGGYILRLPNKENVKIYQNLLDKWEVKATLRGKKYTGERDSLVDIFSAADNLVRNTVPEQVRLVEKGQKWRSKPATLPQLNLLRKLFGKHKPLPKDLDSGMASRIIDRELARRNR